jgi:MFS family permease
VAFGYCPLLAGAGANVLAHRVPGLSPDGGSIMQSQSQAAEAWPGPGRAWFAVGVLFIAVIFSFIDRIILSLLVQPIQLDLGLSDADFAWLLGVAFAVFFALFGLPIGRWADRYSRRLIIAAGIFVWSLMTVACGLAGSFWELFLARVGVAAGEAALAPAAFSMISDLFPREKLGRALGVYQSGAFVGAGFALLVGGVVIGLVAAGGTRVLPVLGSVEPWQIVFIVVGLPGFLVALGMLAVQEPARRSRVPPGTAPGLTEVLRYAVSRWRVYGLHFLGFALLAVPITTTLTWAPVYFGRVLGLAPAQVGYTLGLIVLGLSPAGVYAGGWLADALMRRGHFDAMHRVGLIAAAGLLPLCLFATTGDERTLAVVLFCPLTFFASLALACAPAALQVVTPGPMRAQISAMWMLCLNVITAIVGPTAVGLINGAVFADPLAVGKSLALVNCVSVPLAALAIAAGRRPFAAAAVL